MVLHLHNTMIALPKIDIIKFWNFKPITSVILSNKLPVKWFFAAESFY